MKINESRKIYDKTNKQLRKLRRRYVRKMAQYINMERNKALINLSVRMQQRGLYSKKTHIRCVRQSILSHLYRIEGNKYRGSFFGWYDWLDDNEWDIYRGWSK